MRIARKWRLVAGVLAIMLGCSSGAAGSSIEQSFKSPPESARPYTWWHWLNGNVSKEGITKDLEAMKTVGLAGFQLFDASVGIPPGPVVHNTPEFHELVTFAFSEADRLGLKSGFNNCSGWSSSGGPWITPNKSMKILVWSETARSASDETPVALPKGDFLGKPSKVTAKGKRIDFYRDIVVLAFPTPKDAEYRVEKWLMKGLNSQDGRPDTYIPDLRKSPEDAVIAADSVINVTDRMSADGTLDWTPKRGEWTVIRFGYRPTEAINRPASVGGQGLEVDKLNRAAVEFHWNAFVDKMIQNANGSPQLSEILIDSYEVGMQNWTEGFAREFRKRRGYDLLPMMTALTGRVVDNTETTERILWDLRVTVAALMHENYFGYFAEKCRELGIKFAVESYGQGPFDAPETTLMGDVPMTEFWKRPTDRNLWTWTSQIVSSGAHLSGNPIVGAEAFTSLQGDWTAHPGGIKRWGDRAFARGVNRYYFHTFAHQPFDDSVQPGMTFGRFGGNYHRNNTWFLKSRAWMDYIARCQFLMQSGSYHADVLVLYGDERGFNSFIGPGEPPDMKEIPGLNFDLGGMASLNDLSVDDKGVIRVTRNGKRLDTGYQVLLLKRADLMLPERVAKLGALADQGARIFAPQPLRSPSYSNHEEQDAKLNALVKKYWDTGLIKSPEAFDAAVAKLTKDCDLQFSGGFWSENKKPSPDTGFFVPDTGWLAVLDRVLFNHHKIGEDDFYFLSNQEEEAIEVTATFRVSGKQPELWNPVTGDTRKASNWKMLDDGRTEVRFELPAAGSLFVVFREPTTSKGNTAPKRIDKELMTLNDQWSVTFDPKRGPKAPVKFDTLIPWNESADKQIKYFSGSAVYRKTFTLPDTNDASSLKLDLGQVDVMARVKLNGKDLGLLWCPPFQVDIGEVATPGKNSLEIEVTNLWLNYMIGDAVAPYDKNMYSQIRDGQPFPASSQRKTFQFRVHKGVYSEPTDALHPSGLVGPVRLYEEIEKKAPAYGASVPKPTLSDVRYGEHERQVLDFWKAPSDTPTPLVICIHSGAWVGGNKERLLKFIDIEPFLKERISVVAINYRLIRNIEDVIPPVKAPMHDAARALQFVRSKADEWNVDKERIGATGVSAGACSSLWLLYHDDMAYANSDDPVARQSTRLWCASVLNPQTSLDPKQMKEWIPNITYGGHAFKSGRPAIGEENFAQFLADRENILPWISEYSPYALVSADDPPAELFFKWAPGIDEVDRVATHSAHFGVKLQEHCAKLGVACDVVYPGAEDVKYKTPTDYLIATLKAR